jgi:hypothetical protein
MNGSITTFFYTTAVLAGVLALLCFLAVRKMRSVGEKAAVTAFILLSVLAVGMETYTAVLIHSHTKFDRAIWISDRKPDGIHSLRAPMADDVMHNYLHVGMAKKDVIKLLGGPDRNWDGSNEEMYFLGRWGIGNDVYSYISISYSSSGRVNSIGFFETT